MQINLQDFDHGSSLAAKAVRQKFITEGGVDDKTIEVIHIRLPRDARERFSRNRIVDMIDGYYAAHGRGPGTFFGGVYKIQFRSKRDIVVRLQYQRDI